MGKEKQRAGWLSNRPVQSKMMLALGLVLGAFVVGTVAAVFTQDESERALALSSETYERIVAIDRLTQAAVDQQLSLRGYVITTDPAFLATHDRQRDDFSRQLDALMQDTRADPLQHTRLTEASALMDRYWEQVADPLLALMEHKNTRAQATAVVTSGQDGRYINEIRRAFRDMQATEQQRLQTRSVAIEQHTVKMRRFLFALLTGGVLLGGVAIAIAQLQITNPLVRLGGVIERLAENEANVDVPDQARRDEVGAIARALESFKRMAQSTAAETWVKSGVATIAAKLNEARDHGQFAEIMLAELAPRIGAPVARFYRYHAEPHELRLIAGIGGEGAAVISLTEAAAGQAARQLSADVQPRHYPGAVADTAVLRPIANGGKLVGLLELGRKGTPELKHELLLDELMPIVALSFENLSAAIRLRRSEENLQRANEALRIKSDAALHQATHDPLTHLPNRLLFMKRLEEALVRSREVGASVILCYVDIDGFKPVNDRHGHLAGDLLLCAIAKRLLEGVRSSDTVARLGGDEFVVLMEDLESESGAVETIERLCRRLGEPYLLNSVELSETLTVQIGASIGMALYPRDAGTDDALMKAADTAMYAAKQAGKNRVVRVAQLASKQPLEAKAS